MVMRGSCTSSAISYGALKEEQRNSHANVFFEVREEGRGYVSSNCLPAWEICLGDGVTPPRQADNFLIPAADKCR